MSELRSFLHEEEPWDKEHWEGVSPEQVRGGINRVFFWVASLVMTAVGLFVINYVTGFITIKELEPLEPNN